MWSVTGGGGNSFRPNLPKTHLAHKSWDNLQAVNIWPVQHVVLVCQKFCRRLSWLLGNVVGNWLTEQDVWLPNHNHKDFVPTYLNWRDFLIWITSEVETLGAANTSNQNQFHSRDWLVGWTKATALPWSLLEENGVDSITPSNFKSRTSGHRKWINEGCNMRSWKRWCYNVLHFRCLYLKTLWCCLSVISVRPSLVLVLDIMVLIGLQISSKASLVLVLLFWGCQLYNYV